MGDWRDGLPTDAERAEARRLEGYKRVIRARRLMAENDVHPGQSERPETWNCGHRRAGESPGGLCWNCPDCGLTIPLR